MRATLWFLALFGVAVALALFAGNNLGMITVFWPPHRIDLSLNLVLLLLAGLFMLLHIGLRALAALFSMPAQARRWRLQHQERAMHQALLESFSHLIAGRFLRSRKAAELAIAREASAQRSGEAPPQGPRLRVMAHLLGAESAHALKDQTSREQHFELALAQASLRDAQETREGVLLRGARWALEDRDWSTALRWLDQLPQGAARRTITLRLRLKAARMARQTLQALETARLLAKHRAFSQAASTGVLRSIALELLATAHDPAQLRTVWGQLEPAERGMPEVAIAAAERLLALGGQAAESRQWLLPLWTPLVAGELGDEQSLSLVRVLERGFAQASAAPEDDWLKRIEVAQMSHPRHAALLYLAGMTCMHLQLWGKAQQLLKQSLGNLEDRSLQRQAWRALAELAERRDDIRAATEAWRNAASR